MITKLLTLTAALAVVLPVAAHAENAVRDMGQGQQREMERSQYEAEHSEVRDRLKQDDSVTERDAPARIPPSGSSLNKTAPSSGEPVDTAPAPYSRFSAPTYSRMNQ